MDWQRRYANTVPSLAPSVAVSDLLKLAERPEVVSFAGGLPDPGTFLVEQMQEATRIVMRDQARQALNYGPSLGYTRLREWLAARMEQREGVRVSPQEIIVTSGGLEGISLTASALINPGDTVVVAAPTYLVAIHVFRAHRAHIVSIPCDEGGLNPDALQEQLEKLGPARLPRFLYVMPSFQNPSGLTLSLQRRHKIVAICRRFRIPILEDHAYAELNYQGERLPSLKSLDPDLVIFVHTFSKIFGPGVRLGWVVADPDLVETLGLCKLGTDQCANTLTQRIVYEFGKRGWIADQVEASLPLYRRKRDLLHQELKRVMPETLTWTRPQGGFFSWLTLPDTVDSDALLERAVEKENVAFVAGTPFYANGQGHNRARLSFSFIDQEAIPEGVRRLRSALATFES